MIRRFVGQLIREWVSRSTVDIISSDYPLEPAVEIIYSEYLLRLFLKPTAIQNPDIIVPKLNPQRMLNHGNTMGSQIQSFPEQVRRCDAIRVTAEQEAPHSETLRHSTAIGCLLLSINPTLLKEMSGKYVF